MALDPEELQKRRMERQQRRQARQRRSIVKLVVAVLVLLFAAAVIIALLGRGSDTPSQPEQTTQTGSQETGQTQTQQTQAAENQDTVIRFAAVGDVNITERTIASGGAGYDYSPVFLDVAHLLADADITAMNLEGVLADEPSAQDRVAPRQLLQELQGCGVDLCQVANSYCLSKGVSGLSGTVTQLRGLGLEPLGAFESNEAFSESGGYKYATADKAENGLAERFIRIFSESMLSITAANNLIVIKTISGSAHVAGEAIDSLKWPEVVGTISGDNTLLVIALNAEDAEKLLHKFEQIKRK